MTTPSERGYAYLAELLASRGYMVASVDENFLNRSWNWAGELGAENAARGWLLLEHLKLWREWSQTPGHLFDQRVSMSNIALVGHSRDGEAVLLAAAYNQMANGPDRPAIPFDYGFGIQSVIQIAPVDGQIRPAGEPVPVDNVNDFLLHGLYDSDISNLAAAGAYERARFTDGSDRFKAALFIHRANHRVQHRVGAPGHSRPDRMAAEHQAPALGAGAAEDCPGLYLGFSGCYLARRGGIPSALPERADRRSVASGDLLPELVCRLLYPADRHV